MHVAVCAWEHLWEACLGWVLWRWACAGLCPRTLAYVCTPVSTPGVCTSCPRVSAGHTLAADVRSHAQAQACAECMCISVCPLVHVCTQPCAVPMWSSLQAALTRSPPTFCPLLGLLPWHKAPAGCDHLVGGTGTSEDLKEGDFGAIGLVGTGLNKRKMPRMRGIKAGAGLGFL